MRRDSNRAIATDAEGYELRVGDNMKENDGEVRKLPYVILCILHLPL
jgi:transcription elongation factor SPT5